jgi:hypothetical protein
MKTDGETFVFLPVDLCPNRPAMMFWLGLVSSRKKGAQSRGDTHNDRIVRNVPRDEGEA